MNDDRFLRASVDTAALSGQMVAVVQAQRKTLRVIGAIVSLVAILVVTLLLQLSADIAVRSSQRTADFDKIDTTLNLIKSALCPDQPLEQECVPNTSTETAEALVLPVVNYQARLEGCPTYSSFADLLVALNDPAGLRCGP